MKPWEWKSKFPGMCAVRQAGLAHIMFSTKDPEEWKARLEDLGELYASAWRDDLPEEDRAWAEAHREEFRRWVDDSRRDGEPAPSWSMLLDALKSAFLAFVGGIESTPADESEPATADAASRIYRTYLWKTLSADDAAEVHRDALRAFQRGWRRGHRGGPSSMKTNIPPVLDPPRFWYLEVKEADFPGPSAARERAIRALRSQSHDPKEQEARNRELRRLYASAWREDVPEEDREWAQAYRKVCTDWVNRRRRDAISQSAYEGYLQSSDGIFNGEPAPPWPTLSHRAKQPWRAFAERVEEAPADESELAAGEAALREYWDALYRESPPWDSDPAKVHWLAAVRAARKTLAELATDVPPSH